MSTTATEMYRQIATDQGNLIGLSESGIQQLIAEMQSKTPDKKRVESLLESITILNLQNVNTKITQAGFDLLVDTVRNNKKITSFNFSRTCFTMLVEDMGLQKPKDVQYSILREILIDDYDRPIKLLDLSYSSMKGVGSSGSVGVKDVLSILHCSIGSLYLQNVPPYETQEDGLKESEQLAKELINLLRIVSIKHLNIQGAGIPINEVVRALKHWPIESLNLNNNLIIPKNLQNTIEQLKQSKSLRSISMSNMKFVTDLKSTSSQVKDNVLQENYSRMYQKQLAGIETVAMKTMQQSKAGSSSSASSSSLSSSSGSYLSTSSSPSSSSSSLSMSAIDLGRTPLLQSPTLQTHVPVPVNAVEIVKIEIQNGRNEAAFQLFKKQHQSKPFSEQELRALNEYLAKQMGPSPTSTDPLYQLYTGVKYELQALAEFQKKVAPVSAGIERLSVTLPSKVQPSKPTTSAQNLEALKALIQREAGYRILKLFQQQRAITPYSVSQLTELHEYICKCNKKAPVDTLLYPDYVPTLTPEAGDSLFEIYVQVTTLLHPGSLPKRANTLLALDDTAYQKALTLPPLTRDETNRITSATPHLALFDKTSSGKTTGQQCLEEFAATHGDLLYHPNNNFSFSFGESDNDRNGFNGPGCLFRLGNFVIQITTGGHAGCGFEVYLLGKQTKTFELLAAEDSAHHYQKIRVGHKKVAIEHLALFPFLTGYSYKATGLFKSYSLLEKNQKFCKTKHNQSHAEFAIENAFYETAYYIRNSLSDAIIKPTAANIAMVKAMFERYGSVDYMAHADEPYSCALTDANYEVLMKQLNSFTPDPHVISALLAGKSVLNFRGNPVNMTPQGRNVLCKVLATHRTLHLIQFLNQEINDDLLNFAIEILQDNRSITTIDFAKNESLTLNPLNVTKFKQLLERNLQPDTILSCLQIPTIPQQQPGIEQLSVALPSKVQPSKPTTSAQNLEALKALIQREAGYRILKLFQQQHADTPYAVSQLTELREYICKCNKKPPLDTLLYPDHVPTLTPVAGDSLFEIYVQVTTLLHPGTLPKRANTLLALDKSAYQKALRLPPLKRDEKSKISISGIPHLALFDESSSGKTTAQQCLEEFAATHGDILYRANNDFCFSFGESDKDRNGFNGPGCLFRFSNFVIQIVTGGHAGCGFEVYLLDKQTKTFELLAAEDSTHNYRKILVGHKHVAVEHLALFPFVTSYAATGLITSYELTQQNNKFPYRKSSKISNAEFDIQCAFYETAYYIRNSLSDAIINPSAANIAMVKAMFERYGSVDYKAHPDEPYSCALTDANYEVLMKELNSFAPNPNVISTLLKGKSVLLFRGNPVNMTLQGRKALCQVMATHRTLHLIKFMNQDINNDLLNFAIEILQDNRSITTIDFAKNESLTLNPLNVTKFKQLLARNLQPNTILSCLQTPRIPQQQPRTLIPLLLELAISSKQSIIQNQEAAFRALQHTLSTKTYSVDVLVKTIQYLQREDTELYKVLNSQNSSILGFFQAKTIPPYEMMIELLMDKLVAIAPINPLFTIYTAGTGKPTRYPMVHVVLPPCPASQIIMRKTAVALDTAGCKCYNERGLRCSTTDAIQTPNLPYQKYDSKASFLRINLRKAAGADGYEEMYDRYKLQQHGLVRKPATYDEAHPTLTTTTSSVPVTSFG